jgi:kynurenine formamidase
MAVLLHTGDNARFGSPAYAEDRHFLTRAGAAWLADHDAALVGIDTLNIDDTADRTSADSRQAIKEKCRVTWADARMA